MKIISIPGAPICCCGSPGCCAVEPTGSIVLTFASDCDDVDGHQITLRRVLDGWAYRYQEDGVDPVFQDIDIDVFCKPNCDGEGNAAYALSLSSGCMPVAPYELCADEESLICDPFEVSWSDISSGTITGECFDCVELGQSFTYSITAAEPEE